jgi:hypothetical protein
MKMINEGDVYKEQTNNQLLILYIKSKTFGSNLQDTTFYISKKQFHNQQSHSKLRNDGEIFTKQIRVGVLGGMGKIKTSPGGGGGGAQVRYPSPTRS